MLSGEFSSIRVDQISINRDERIRKKISDDSVEKLAESISRLGLIHPIVLDSENNLVAGETRLRAVISLGWDRVPFQYTETLNPNDLLAIELEENVKRKDLDWKETCDALRRFHKLKLETNESWTQTATANELGFTVGYVNELLGVSEALARGDAMVAAAPKLTTARAIVARQNQRRDSDLVSGIANAVQTPKSKEILIEDFNAWAPNYFGPPFNFIHCDFPYGIGLDKSDQAATQELGAYDDSEETYWTLINTLLNNRDILLADSAHIIFWFSMNYYQKTLEALREHFRVDPYPLIWFKSDNKGILPDPSRGPRRNYETAFFCSHGDRRVVMPVSNVFAGPVEKIVGHTSEKSEAMLKHFFRMTVDENTRLLDPCCGSGSAIRAAKSMGANSALGLELNESFAKDAIRGLL